MEMPTAEEREAFLWMQGRMVELLQRHDVARFRRTFTEREADPETSSTGDHAALLRRQRDLAVFFYLQTELFENILPRIKRRLSFVAPHTMRKEALPSRGRIDWARTATAMLHDQPGEAPLSVVTRQRRRHFATAENLLTVVTLQEYQDAAQALLDSETAPGSSLIRHPLHDIVESCTRELVFPQFAGLVSECRAIRADQGSQTVDGLEGAVAENAQAGRNSAYADLLTWRQRLGHLRLLDRTAAGMLQSMIGSNPRRDNYLYQLWLFYELVDLLQQEGCLREWDVTKMTLTYAWGEGNDQREYRLQHDRGIPDLSAIWSGAPGVRPDFYIARTDRQEVREGATILWHEPGYMLDAKYYRPSDSEKAPASPIKRMIADLHLTGERTGSLLFAFHGQDPEETGAEPGTTAPPEERGQISERIYPQPERAQRSAPDMHIQVHHIQPGFSGEADRRDGLQAILMRAHRLLMSRIPIRCHGILLDSLTATAHGTLASVAGLQQRTGAVWPAPAAGQDGLEDLVVCPKPHVGPWRVDLVSREHDCCRNAAVCHILSVADLPRRKPERLTMLDAVTAAIQETAEDADPEISAQRAEEYVRVIGKRYVKLLQQDLMYHQRWVQQELDIGEEFYTTALLTDTQRETLGLAHFLWVQIDQIGAKNFAAPSLLFTGVLEEITKMTIYKVQQPPLADAFGKRLQETLGTLGRCKDYNRGQNWQLLDHTVNGGGYWQAHISDEITLSLEKWISGVRSIVDIRNNAAHKAHVDPKDFLHLKTTLFGSTRSGMGLLNGILLAWQTRQPNNPSAGAGS